MMSPFGTCWKPSRISAGLSKLPVHAPPLVGLAVGVAVAVQAAPRMATPMPSARSRLIEPVTAVSFP